MIISLNENERDIMLDALSINGTRHLLKGNTNEYDDNQKLLKKFKRAMDKKVKDKPNAKIGTE